MVLLSANYGFRFSTLDFFVTEARQMLGSDAGNEWWLQKLLRDVWQTRRTFKGDCAVLDACDSDGLLLPLHKQDMAIADASGGMTGVSSRQVHHPSSLCVWVRPCGLWSEVYDMRNLTPHRLALSSARIQSYFVAGYSWYKRAEDLLHGNNMDLMAWD